MPGRGWLTAWDALAAGLTPPPRRTLSQWSDDERVLSPEASAEPGRWRTSRAEYLRGIMDACSDPRVEQVVLMASSQVGKSEVINNLIGYHVDQDPAPMLLVQPTEAAARSYSQLRIAPMLRDTPALRGKVSEAKSRNNENTTLQKIFTGGYLALVGSNSPSGLSSRPVRVVMVDEVDRMEPTSEGDAVNCPRHARRAWCVCSSIREWIRGA